MISPASVSTYDYKGTRYERNTDQDDGGPFRVLISRWFSPEFADFATLHEAQSFCAYCIEWDDDNFWGYAAPQYILNMETGEEEGMWG